MSDWSIESVAAELLACEDGRRDRAPFTDEWPDLDLDTGYAIQDRNLAARLARGEKVVGIKLGPLSGPRPSTGAGAPIMAWLTDAMILPTGYSIPQTRLIHPRVEPEIVFLMGDRLEGPGVSAASAMAAVESVHAGVEIVDSRYRDYRATIADACADNASAAAFVVGGTGAAPADLDLITEGVLLEVDGVIVDSATGAAVHGHPGQALALAANALAHRGLAIEAGWIVLTGGMTGAVPGTAGVSIGAHFSSLGSIFLTGGDPA